MSQIIHSITIDANAEAISFLFSLAGTCTPRRCAVIQSGDGRWDSSSAGHGQRKQRNGNKITVTMIAIADRKSKRKQCKTGQVKVIIGPLTSANKVIFIRAMKETKESSKNYMAFAASFVLFILYFSHWFARSFSRSHFFIFSSYFVGF